MTNSDAAPDATPAASVARAVLAGHGDFAAGLASAVALISGRDDAFALVTNRDRSGVDIERVIRESLGAGDGGVVFTDLPAGSCTLAARRLQRDRPRLVVVTGANLATLLDFVFAADAPDVAPEQAARDAAERGRAALAALEAPRPRAAGEEGARGAG